MFVIIATGCGFKPRPGTALHQLKCIWCKSLTTLRGQTVRKCGPTSQDVLAKFHSYETNFNSDSWSESVTEVHLTTLGSSNESSTSQQHQNEPTVPRAPVVLFSPVVRGRHGGWGQGEQIRGGRSAGGSGILQGLHWAWDYLNFEQCSIIGKPEFNGRILIIVWTAWSNSRYLLQVKLCFCQITA